MLTSRTGIRSGYQARCVHFWRRMKISVLVSTLNISKKVRRLGGRQVERGEVRRGRKVGEGLKGQSGEKLERDEVKGA